MNDTISVKIINDQLTFLDYLIDPGIIIAIIALIVSGLGLCLAYHFNRKSLNQSFIHNKKSTEPLLNYHQQFIDNKQILTLENNGLGPAFIQTIHFIYQSKVYFDLRSLYKAHWPDIYNRINTKKGTLVKAGSSFYISQNNSKLLNEVYFMENPPKLKELRNVLRRINFVVMYKTIYEEVREYNTQLS